MKKISLLCVCLMVGICLVASVAYADGVKFIGTLNAPMYATGGNISATIGKCWASYNSNISLYTYIGTRLSLLGLIGNSKSDFGDTVSFSGVAKGTEIIAGIYVNNTKKTYYSGPKGRRLLDSAHHVTEDGHAKIDFTGVNPLIGKPVLVGFEDLCLSSADKDYNDVTLVSLSGVGPVRLENDPKPVPEPGTILAALSILAPAGMLFRRRK